MMISKNGLLLSCLMSMLLGSAASASESSAAIVLYTKDGASNYANCDGIYLPTFISINSRTVYVNEEKQRMLGWNGRNFVITSTIYLPSILEGAIAQHGFGGYHFARTLDELDQYRVRHVTDYAIGVEQNQGNNFDSDKEGIYRVSTHEINGREVYINEARGRMLVFGGVPKSCVFGCGDLEGIVRIEDGRWINDDLSNLAYRQEDPYSLQYIQRGRSSGEDITEGWDREITLWRIKTAQFTMQQDSEEDAAITFTLSTGFQNFREVYLEDGVAQTGNKIVYWQPEGSWGMFQFTRVTPFGSSVEEVERSQSTALPYTGWEEFTATALNWAL